MKMKTLETDRLILRQINEEDAKKIFENWTSDDDVTRYVRWNTHKNIDETKEYIKMTHKRCEEDNNFEWGIVLKENNELIGAMGAFPGDDDRIEIGYNISKKYWNNGYTTEALKKVMEYLINDVGIKKFICSHAVQNPASGKVMQKAGFKYVKNTVVGKFDGSQQFDTKVYYLDAK